jgi:hypothetical protein
MTCGASARVMHGWTVLVSAFCESELRRRGLSLGCKNQSSRSPGMDRQRVRDVRYPDAGYSTS